MEMNKKAFFFSTDALVALSLLIIIILLMYPSVSNISRKDNEQSDMLKVLSRLKVSTINNSYTKSLIESGQITNLNNSILEQVGEFYVTNITLAKEFLDNITGGLNYRMNLGIWYGDKLISAKNSSPYEASKEVYVSKQVISGIKEGESVTGFSARASLTNNLQSKYSYFGGYVGDGNITILMDYSGVIDSAYTELAVSKNFSVYVNGIFSGNYQKSDSDFKPSNYSIPIADFVSGENTIEIKDNAPNSNASFYIAGGFINVKYREDGVQYSAPTKYYFPGIEGIVNLYDGLYVPGKLNDLGIFLHFNSSYSIIFTIGNVTVYNGSSSGENTTYLNNSYLASILDYDALSNQTVPIRLGLQSVLLNGTGGNADVILITDTSGSMDWRLNADVTGTARACNDANLNAGTTKRISLAQCLDSDFINTVLSVNGNRVGLVSFSSSAGTFTNLTSNITLLNGVINGYSASGSTCISCAINRAYLMLLANSNSSRKKFIVSMTDGVANVRSTPTCNDLYGNGAYDESNEYAAGIAGNIIKKNMSNNLWDNIYTPNGNQINDMEFYNSDVGFAVGNSGTILKWNGTGWQNDTTPTTYSMNGIDIYNQSLAIAAGASGRVIKWDGSSWSALATIANSPTLNAVSIYNKTLIYIAGVRGGQGRIYKSSDGGANWVEEYSSGSNFKGIRILNSTRGYAVGLGGAIRMWNGTGWNNFASPTGEDLYTINSINSSFILAGGGNAGDSIMLKNIGGAWSTNYSNVSDDSIRDIVLFNNTAFAVGKGGVIIEYNYSSKWTRNFNNPEVYQGNLTSGITCNADEDSCSEISSFPSLNANYSSCRAHNELNATIYSIGFGPVASCNFAIWTLQNIANCGNGTFYSSSNATELEEFYQSIANDITKISYLEQMAQIQGNVSSKLYTDSYISFNYTSFPQTYGAIFTIEKKFDNNLSGSFSLPASSSVVESKVVSYSGPLWTHQLNVNGKTVYNLSMYGNKYYELGDPYPIYFNPKLVLNQNNVTLTTGISPSNITNGSEYNKIIYTIVKNLSSFSPVSVSAQGCEWIIEFEGNSTISIDSPPGYYGPNKCYYNSSGITYDSNDAFQSATEGLFGLLDFDSNGKIDVIFDTNEINLNLTEINGIPYTWSTEVQIRTWA